MRRRGPRGETPAMTSATKRTKHRKRVCAGNMSVGLFVVSVAWVVWVWLGLLLYYSSSVNMLLFLFFCRVFPRFLTHSRTPPVLVVGSR